MTEIWTPIGPHIQQACTAVETIGVPAGANALLVSATGQTVRITLDGLTDPAPDMGIPILVAAGPVLIRLAEGKQIRAIQSQSSGILEVQPIRIFELGQT